MTSSAFNEHINRTVVFPSIQHHGYFSLANVRASDVNEEIVDAGFTKAVGCETYKGGCEGLEKDFRFASAVPLAAHWKYKYLIDIDGYGYSGRFLAFMLSESAVLKSTVYQEFFSDWLQPW